MTLDNIKTAVANAWTLLFDGTDGVVTKFITWLGANPVFLLPLGFYLVFLGIKTVRKLITGF